MRKRTLAQQIGAILWSPRRTRCAYSAHSSCLFAQACHIAEARRKKCSEGPLALRERMARPWCAAEPRLGTLCDSQVTTAAAARACSHCCCTCIAFNRAHLSHTHRAACVQAGAAHSSLPAATGHRPDNRAGARQAHRPGHRQGLRLSVLHGRPHVADCHVASDGSAAGATQGATRPSCQLDFGCAVRAWVCNRDEASFGWV